MSNIIKKIVYFFKRLYFRLVIRKPITIIANDCCGGCIYSDIGMRFLSPTINTYIDGASFVLFVNNLEHFFKIDLKEVHCEKKYPVGVLHSDSYGDVYINFVHYSNFEEARSKWLQRKNRIINDNIFIIFHVNDEDVKYVDDIKKIKNNKIILGYCNQNLRINDDVYIFKSIKKFIPAKILQFNFMKMGRYLEEINYRKILLFK